MRKLWYAGAALTGGLVLFAGSPAQADLLPGVDAAAQQADERLADLLGQSNGVNVDNPLRHSTLKDSPAGRTPVTQFKAGQNKPDLDPLLPGEGDGGPRRGLTPDESTREVPADEEPDADVVSGPTSALPIQELPLFGSGGLPLLSGLLPSGQIRDFNEPPSRRQAEMFDGGVPLLGGLGGLLPANESPRTPPAVDDSPRTLPATDEPDLSGMPAGGVAIMPAAPSSATPSSAQQPAKPAKPAVKPQKKDKPQPKPKPTATPDDPRLFEEPVEIDDADDTDVAVDEPERRPFSADGRPVAGVDEQYR
ncbi:hypothetical protein M1L60_27700 [Actinoplanes sp. TRM 88003]|uniref:Uncharacterized protein n=1 Tax=Paractinoplanes aksuensis TaxID=2939490 RepID=A0ABT1DWR2_9ACTN|nr:hypothetical protein [Actinoplanes aksuensis]MCO8274390.1 hypothetical protein [Actinoplanes aksuensis]